MQGELFTEIIEAYDDDGEHGVVMMMVAIAVTTAW